ncbi:esterase-like activity of phytase family protein [Actinocorallia longicatena]|uniref:Esterase-like activity of phytase family protein n=1 Tax=Actinocorallia longicatena TaxID=111803 RepID=A0ABP6QKD4_9ACTN
MPFRIPRRGLAAAAVAVALPMIFAPGAQAGKDQPFFERLATYPVVQNLPADTATVAEISAVTEDGETLIYTDAIGRNIGFLDISRPKAPQGLGVLPLGPGDSPTSVAVVGGYALAVIDSSPSFTAPSGRVDVIRISDRTVVRSIDLGGQPDSIALSKNGRFAAIAIENQRDEEFTPAGGKAGDLPQAPGGFLQILDLPTANPASWAVRAVPFTQPGGAALPSFTAAGIAAPADPEVEYVSVNGKGKIAVTLQENNGVVIVDGPSGTIDEVFSAGKVSLTGIDSAKDGFINPTGSITDVPREPDAVGWIDDHHLATANEGDWKGGSRGWTVFSDTGTVVWDAGNTFEHLAIEHGLHNEDRAAKKGSEPEGLAVGTFNGRRYAFVGSERSNFVAVYDVENPANPVFKQLLPTNAGPEGLLPIPGKSLFAVSAETDNAAVGLRATVQLFRLDYDERAEFPQVRSQNALGWAALSGFSPVPGQPEKLYAVSDAAFNRTSIYTIDTGQAPALVESALTVTKNGQPAGYDAEGVAARQGGGWWIASEGDTASKLPLAKQNLLVAVDASGAVTQEVPLPAEVSSVIGKQGLEGVTVTGSGASEQVYFTLQRPLPADPADTVRIGRYTPATGAFAFWGYKLEPSASAANWNGLSEIVHVSGDAFAVVERDKASGPAAAHKKIYSFHLTPAAPSGLPVVPKTLVRDLLPDLRLTNGWTQEKVESLTILGDGTVWFATDNDGLTDATGETVLRSLGQAKKLFRA